MSSRPYANRARQRSAAQYSSTAHSADSHEQHAHARHRHRLRTRRVAGQWQQVSPAGYSSALFQVATSHCQRVRVSTTSPPREAFETRHSLFKDMPLYAMPMPLRLLRVSAWPRVAVRARERGRRGGSSAHSGGEHSAHTPRRRAPTVPCLPLAISLRLRARLSLTHSLRLRRE